MADLFCRAGDTLLYPFVSPVDLGGGMVTFRAAFSDQDHAPAIQKDNFHLGGIATDGTNGAVQLAEGDTAPGTWSYPALLRYSITIRTQTGLVKTIDSGFLVVEPPAGGPFRP